MILSDNETKIDLLNYEAIASTIVQLLRKRSEHPITIGVHGYWGAGKSSVLEMIECELEEEKDVVCLKFNGWRFQGFEDAKIALLEGIVTELVEKRSLGSKAADKVKAVYDRIDWLKVAKKSGGLALTALTGVPTPDMIEGAVTKIKDVLSNPTALATKENVDAAMAEAEGLIKPASENNNVPKEVKEFHKAFDELLDAARISQLVVLIDDLDRCLPDTAIETLEAVRLFVFTARTAFVIAADEAMIEYAVRKHFPDLPDTTGPQTYARNYLEKLIQVPFRIPALGETETRIYVTLLLIGAELGEEDPDFQKLIPIAREKLERPWIGSILDASAVKTALGNKTAHVKDALALSDQIGPILATGAKGNPRQIKRFLNTLVLRKLTADARGFGGDLQLPVLAKLMLAESFLPRLFEQIATSAASAPNGICAGLAELEDGAESESVTARPKVTTAAAKHISSKDDARTASLGPADTGHLSEWLSSPFIRAWAAVQPWIGDVDLRPYIFVTKDRKDYFGAASALGHLAAIAEQLLGTKIVVQPLEGDLKRLAPPEAAQLFEALRGRIVGSGSLEREPAGVAGLAILVKAQPTLQSNLLDFLESLPHDRIGAWVVSGWNDAIKDSEPAKRFDKLLDNWTNTRNAILKAAASNVKRIRKEAG